MSSLLADSNSRWQVVIERWNQLSEMPMRGKRGKVRPPSMTMARPVTKSNAGEQTSTTMLAISRSVTSRPSGVPAIAASL